MTDAPFKRVLLPVAHEEDAEATCAVARPYFEGHADELVFVHVIETGGDGPSKTSPEALKDRAGDVFASVRDHFEGSETPIRTELRSGPDIVTEVFDTADGIDASAIALTPRSGNRLTKLLSGDLKHEMTETNRHPIVILPRLPETHRSEAESGDELGVPEGATIVVPVDGSDASVAAVRHARTTFPEAEITLLHVLESQGSGVYESMTGAPSNDYEDAERQRRAEAERIFDDIHGALDDLDADLATEIRVGDVAETIASYAEDTGAEQIVMGRSDEGGITKRLFGGVTENVVNRSTVPVTAITR